MLRVVTAGSVDDTDSVADDRTARRASARHLAVLATVRVPRLVVCANKIHLAGYAREPFERVRNALEAAAQRPSMPVPVVVPVSARHGNPCCR